MNKQLRLSKRVMCSASLSPFDCIVTSPFSFSRPSGAVSAAFCLRLVYYFNPSTPPEKEVNPISLPFVLWRMIYFSTAWQNGGSSGQLNCSVIYFKKSLFCSFSGLIINSFFFSRIACTPTCTSRKTSMWTYFLCWKLTKVFQISEIRSLVKSTSYPACAVSYIFIWLILMCDYVFLALVINCIIFVCLYWTIEVLWKTTHCLYVSH